MEALFLQGITIQGIENIIEEKLRKVLSENSNSDYKKPPVSNYLSRKQTASLLHISLVTLASLTSSGRLKSYRIGKRVLYRQDEVEEALTEIKPYKRT